MFQYHSDFPSSIKEHVVFVDMAPRFHLMAEEILHRQIQLVILNLREVGFPEFKFDVGQKILKVICVYELTNCCFLTLHVVLLLGNRWCGWISEYSSDATI